MFTAIKLDEIQGVKLSGDVTWLPLRQELGYKAHGINAWVAEKVGADVIERHSESAVSKHQEMYLVLSGRARFEIDGEVLDAPAGTMVCVPDWQSERCAIAEEAGTAVLSFGGPASFEPSPWEWTHRALLSADNDPDGAREIFEDGLRELPDNAAMHYNYACLEVKVGNFDAAVKRLEKAFELRPELRDHAATDSDLAALREHSAFPANL